MPGMVGASAAASATPRLSVVIPTLNEAENVELLAAALARTTPSGSEIIFVDDGSTDGTVERIRAIENSNLRLLVRDTTDLGLAGAVLAGAQVARGDILVVMDADFSHPPAAIYELVTPIDQDVADLVIGSRYVSGSSTPGWPLWRRLMSRAAAALSYPLTGVHDSMCGFFAIRRHLFLLRACSATGFKIAFEIIVAPGPRLRILELPITFQDRARGVSKMRPAVAFVFALRWLAAVAKLASRVSRSK